MPANFGVTYEVYITATNCHGTSEVSNTATLKRVEPCMSPPPPYNSCYFRHGRGEKKIEKKRGRRLRREQERRRKEEKKKREKKKKDRGEARERRWDPLFPVCFFSFVSIQILYLLTQLTQNCPMCRLQEGCFTLAGQTCAFHWIS